MTVSGLMVWGPTQTVQVMVLLLFCSNALIFAIFQFLDWRSKQEEGKSAPVEEEGVELLQQSAGGNKIVASESAVAKAHSKELTKPFTASFECCTTLTSELFRTSIIMAFTYICERHWYLEHSGKEYSRDHFLFILFIFFLYAFYTIKPIRDTSILGREQSEEWKGWMQFIFLLYHYFHAEEVYNSVRVMITCYVWMTGFGNFSFFYVKQDFGWLRVAQMLWRLNFSVLLLMWTHGNTWILYYICPMHTFYFLMVYATMYAYSHVNHTKYGIRYKLLAVGVLIYIVWDVNGGLFDTLFAWLGTDKIIGASNGSVWEYYFRTSLDHWSSYLGMIFALNFPLIEQYYKIATVGGSGPLYVCAAIMLALVLWWFFIIYLKPKMEYNLLHSYFAIIPLTAYVFFRNISMAARSYVSMSLHDLGKTTLETYLLQHHIWLTSNAKTLLTWIPDQPYINFGIATIVFFIVSKELYRITMSLRGLIVPDDPTVARLNLLGSLVVLCVCYSLAAILQSQQASLWLVLMTACLLAAAAFQALVKFAPKLRSHQLLQNYAIRATLACGALALLSLMMHAISGGSATELTVPTVIGTGPGVVGVQPRTLLPECGAALSQGHWIDIDCSQRRVLKGLEALCETKKWLWDAPPQGSRCPVPSKITSTKAQALFAGRSIVFIGDSVVRQTYHQFAALLDSSYKAFGSVTFDQKHTNLAHSVPAVGAKLQFLWAPYASNVTALLSGAEGPAMDADYVIAGGGLWDALHERSVQSYKGEIGTLAASFQRLNARHVSSIQKESVGTTLGLNAGVTVTTRPLPVYVWLLPTTIYDARLTPEKLQHMNEETVRSYRSTAMTGLAGAVDLVLDATNASSLHGSSSMDGIHFVDSVYQVISQMIAGAYGLRYPARLADGGNSLVKAPKPYEPKVTGSMSFPSYGLLVLLISAIMMWGFDSLLGVGYLSLAIFGRTADWEAAYTPLHKKLGISAAGVSTGGEPAGASGTDISPAASAPVGAEA